MRGGVYVRLRGTVDPAPGENCQRDTYRDHRGKRERTPFEGEGFAVEGPACQVEQNREQNDDDERAGI